MWSSKHLYLGNQMTSFSNSKILPHYTGSKAPPSSQNLHPQFRNKSTDNSN